MRIWSSCSGLVYSEDLKLCTILNNTPEPLRSQLQLRISATTTYAQLREMVLQFEKLNTRWVGSTSMPASGNPYSSDGPAPMDVGRVEDWYKGGKGAGCKKGDGKGKKGGKGKFPKGGKGGGKSFGGKKGEGKGKKGKGYSSPNPKGGKGKGKGDPSKTDVCNYCGGRGHWKNECWKRQADNKAYARTVPDMSQAPADSSRASTVDSDSTWRTGGVRRVRLTTPPWLCTTEIFDLTEEGDADFHGEDEGVSMITETSGCTPEHFDLTYSDMDGLWNIFPSLHEFDLTDDFPESCDLQTISSGVVPECVILDSGADCSVAPPSFSAFGSRSSGRQPVLHDAQGGLISSSGARTCTLTCNTLGGERIAFKETFVIGNVKSPLVSLGKLVKQGWQVSHVDGSACLSNGRHHIPNGTKKNTLVMDVHVGAEEEED